VDRFRWTGNSLVFEKNLIKLRQFQNDGGPTPPGQGDLGQPERGNHDGGIIAFGPDKKLYVFTGDAGRRGQLQNLPSGPTATGLGPVVPDDQFGGPQPDDAHFSGVILRLNDDGSTPADNPFYAAGAAIGGEAGENIQKVYVYGVRNGFGMAFDPLGGGLWFQENGEDAFDEINRAEPGMNSGWIQIQGPLARLAEYKAIETTSTHGGEPTPNLQQLRWGPERIADTQAEALARLFQLPGSAFRNPEFSWKYVVAPAGLGFAASANIGSEFEGDLFVGLSVPQPLGGALYRFNLSGDRKTLAFTDAALADGVADNATFNDLGEQQSLLVGRDFGVVTDIESGPNGLLYVVSLTNNAVYEISQRPKGAFKVRPTGLEFSARPNPARGGASIELHVTTPQRITAEIFNVAG
jgi:glucose/arabinose dehydrogenase